MALFMINLMVATVLFEGVSFNPETKQTTIYYRSYSKNAHGVLTINDYKSYMVKDESLYFNFKQSGINRFDAIKIHYYESLTQKDRYGEPYRVFTKIEKVKTCPEDMFEKLSQAFPIIKKEAKAPQAEATKVAPVETAKASKGTSSTKGTKSTNSTKSTKGCSNPSPKTSPKSPKTGSSLGSNSETNTSELSQILFN